MNKITKNILLIIGILLCLSIILGISYAYWKLVLQQKDSNVITSDCFSITFTDENDISLEQAYPLNKEEMISYLKTATPYHFTITNKCDSVARGYINLETMPVEGKRLSDQYIDALLYDGNTNLSDAIYFNTYDYVLPSYIVLYPTKDSPDDFISHYSFLLNNADINEEKVISNSLTAYKLSDILLRAGESLEFNLLLWMDESTPVSDEVMNAYWNGKITVSVAYSTLKPEDDLVYQINEPYYMADVELDEEKCLQTVPSEESVICNEEFMELIMRSSNREEVEEYVDRYMANFDFITLNGIIETRDVAVTAYKSGGTYINDELDYIEGVNMHAIIPDEIDGYPVRIITGPFEENVQGDGFSGVTYSGSILQSSAISGYNYNTIITSVDIGSNIYVIDTAAFIYNRLQNIKFAPYYGYLAITNNAFQGNLLTELTLPQGGLIALENYTFADNHLKTVQFNGAVNIGENAFLNNQLTELRFDYEGTTIERCAFCNNPITTIINNTGQSFNWLYILTGESGETFETGTLEIDGRAIQIIKE